MTVTEFCEELGIARSTWDEWKVAGKVPTYLKLPNGRIRIPRAEFELWLEGLVAA